MTDATAVKSMRRPATPHEATGRLIAAAYTQAWHSAPPPLTLAATELQEIAPLLLQSSGAALIWRRLRSGNLASHPAAQPLRQAYRLHLLQAAVHEGEIRKAITYLRHVGIEPLLGKGWAIARVYPARGLRPFGDIDLYIHPQDYARAVAAIQTPGAPSVPVDLHKGVASLTDRRFEEVYDRSQVEALGDMGVRILGAEDHLRLLCLHMLGHGAWRPIWLCDIAAAIEARSDDFDWDYFMSGDRRRTRWAMNAIELARHLLNADADGLPASARNTRLPRWLTPSLLQQWGKLQIPHGCRTGMAAYMRDPKGMFTALRTRWPNPIEATIGTGGPFNDWPRLPFQIGESLLRSASFVARLIKSARMPARVFDAQDFW
jgi:hypothetical protein